MNEEEFFKQMQIEAAHADRKVDKEMGLEKDRRNLLNALQKAKYMTVLIASGLTVHATREDNAEFNALVENAILSMNHASQDISAIEAYLKKGLDK